MMRWWRRPVNWRVNLNGSTIHDPTLQRFSQHSIAPILRPPARVLAFPVPPSTSHHALDFGARIASATTVASRPCSPSGGGATLAFFSSPNDGNYSRRTGGWRLVFGEK